MTSHIETCAAILAQSMRITAKGKWHVFCDYAAHIPALYVRWESADTDYQNTERKSHEGVHAYLEWADSEQQLSAIRAELDKLEGGE